MSTPTETPSVTRAFADLDQARAALANASATVRIHRNALRRWARQHGYRVVEARWRQQEADKPAWEARFLAEYEHRRALRAFRTRAMIAALERVVDTDRRLNAA